MCELNIIRERRGSFLRLGRRFGAMHSKQKSKPCGRHGMTDAMIEGGRVMDYSSRILNLRLDTRAEVAPMKFGHADARHAAAEIARQAEAKIEELEAKLAKAVRERDEALNQLFIAAEVAEGAGAGAILYLRLLQLRVAELRGQDDE